MIVEMTRDYTKGTMNKAIKEQMKDIKEFGVKLTESQEKYVKTCLEVTYSKGITATYNKIIKSKI